MSPLFTSPFPLKSIWPKFFHWLWEPTVHNCKLSLHSRHGTHWEPISVANLRTSKSIRTSKSMCHCYQKTRSQGLIAHLIYLSINFAITWNPLPIPSRERIVSGSGANPFWASDWLREITWLLGVDPLSGGDRKWIRSRSILSLWLAQGDHMTFGSGSSLRRGSEVDPFSIFNLWLAERDHIT